MNVYLVEVMEGGRCASAITFYSGIFANPDAVRGKFLEDRFETNPIDGYGEMPESLATMKEDDDYVTGTFYSNKRLSWHVSIEKCNVIDYDSNQT